MIAKATNSKIREANERVAQSFARYANPAEEQPPSRLERELSRKAMLGGYKMHSLSADPFYGALTRYR